MGGKVVMGTEGMLPPYPVSASAIRGTEGFGFAIISACSRMSFRVAKPRSGFPSLDA